MSEHSFYDLTKDFIVPIIGSVFGVLGAFFVLKHQLKKQAQAEEEKSNSQSRSVRRIYQSNIQSLIVELDKIHSAIEREYEKISDENFDFNPSVLSFRPQSLKLLLKLDYENHFVSHLVAGFDSTEHFNLSYKSLIRLDLLVDKVNSDVENYHHEFSQVLQGNHLLINSILQRKSAIYIDIKKIIREQYQSLKEGEKKTATFQQTIFKKSLNSKFLQNPQLDSEYTESFVEECNSALNKLMKLSVKANQLEETFFTFLGEYDNLRGNLD
ncbi:hypothetical protein OHD16_13030 [Sphingobacterium sp. ML3W]|uniref:hypothetical protein n=1 Tax=Sphingobacterium sp. ML3W TaxID=1538644 RepID=UPI00249BC4EC|nr:hypothetical protein [Sphingobacterium sp. ML3W]WFA80883.1 hypothetical protein OGI71_06175 [Sphingobacterium sp. ML3W]